MKKHSIAVGDRVRAYGVPGFMCTGESGTVRKVENGWLDIEGDNGGVAYAVHPKQCRRLKKRERRRVWVLREKLEAALEVVRSGSAETWPLDHVRTADMYTGDERYVEFIEVKRG